MFIFSCALFSEFLLFVLFFHLGLFYWSGSQSFMSEQLAFLFTTPLNFQKRKVNIYDQARSWGLRRGVRTDTNRDLRYNDNGLRTTVERALLCLQHWVESCKYRTLRLQYRHKTTTTTREEVERETTRKHFLVFMFSSQKCKYFACDLIKNNEQILPYWGKQLRQVKLVNKVLVTQFLFFRP